MAAEPPSSDTKSVLDEKTFKHAIFRRGTKEELFRSDDGQSDDGAIPEDVSGDEKLPQLHQLWSLERKGRDLSAAIWRPERCAAELVMQKGKLFAHIGILCGGKTYLTIEEAVYMVDRGSMLLFREDERDGKKVLLSVKECTSLMASCGVGLDHLGCYAKLLRAGFCAHRFGLPMAVKDRQEARDMQFGFNSGGEDGGNEGNEGRKRRHTGAPAAVPVPASSGKKAKTGGTGASARLRETETETTETTRSRHTTQDWWPAQAFTAGAAPLPCVVVPNNVEKKEAKRKAFPHLRPLRTRVEGDFVEKHADRAGEFFFLDVYPPNANFSRKNPGKKAAVLSMIANGKAAVPHQSLIQDVDAAARAANVDEEQPPTRYCTLEHGDIAFYSLVRTNIRDIH